MELVSREELLANINIHMPEIERHRKQLEFGAHTRGEPFIPSPHPLLVFLEHLGSGRPYSCPKTALVWLFDRDFKYDLAHIGVGISGDFDMFRVSCVMLVYQSHPKEISQALKGAAMEGTIKCTMTSVRDNKPYLYAECIDDIFGDFTTNMRKSEDETQHKELLSGIRKRLQWYLWMGLDPTSPHFVYPIACGVVGYTSMVKSKPVGEYGRSYALMRVELARSILMMCFERGCSLETVEEYCRTKGPAHHITTRWGACNRKADEFPGNDCCISCKTFKIVCWAHQQFVSCATLFVLILARSGCEDAESEK